MDNRRSADVLAVHGTNGMGVGMRGNHDRRVLGRRRLLRVVRPRRQRVLILGMGIVCRRIVVLSIVWMAGVEMGRMVVASVDMHRRRRVGLGRHVVEVVLSPHGRPRRHAGVRAGHHG